MQRVRERLASRARVDAVVLGGGPGGACAASALARSGWSVQVLERSRFPRYAVGESIIPYAYAVLDQLGLYDKVRSAGFQRKHGFQFVGRSGKVTPPYYFAQSMVDPRAMTWSVDRASFDHLLLEHARESGAWITEEAKVTEVLREGERVVGVRYRAADGRLHEVRARIVVDATGRGALLSRRLGLRVKDPVLDQVAAWRYVRGAHRQEGRAAGNIVIALLEPRGWFWWIPMKDDVTSVGVVAPAGHLKRLGASSLEAFHAGLASNPTLAEWTRGGEWISDCRTTGDYSYSSTRFAGDGYVLVGDAAAFIDPVFSTGIWLAIASGSMAAEAADRALSRGLPAAADFRDYEVVYRRAQNTFRIFLDAFYDENFSAGAFLRDCPEWIPEWGRVLQGDVFDDNRAFNAFLMDYRGRLARERGTEARLFLPEGWAEDHYAPDAVRPPSPIHLGSLGVRAPARGAAAVRNTRAA